MMGEHETNRREFLRGRSALEAITHSLDRAVQGADDEASGLGAQTYLIRAGRRAMACEFEVLLNAGQYEDATERAVEALDLVDELESQLTVYRDSSEISWINQHAFQSAVVVEPRLFALLQFAAGLHVESGGAFDIASGALSRVWGFSRREGRIPCDAELRAALQCTGMRHLVLDPANSSVRFAAAGVEINLGSIGKGYALDRVAAYLLDAGIGDFLLHGGQSSILARGDQGERGAGWSVGVVDPLRPERRLARIYVHSRGVGTSGASTQFFRHNGKRLGHILDPRTGWPAEGMLSTTVVAPTAAEADALATAFYVLGTEQSIAYCRKHPEIAAILIASGAGGTGCDVQTVGFAEHELEMERCGEGEVG